MQIYHSQIIRILQIYTLKVYNQTFKNYYIIKLINNQIIKQKQQKNSILLTYLNYFNYKNYNPLQLNQFYKANIMKSFHYLSLQKITIILFILLSFIACQSSRKSQPITSTITNAFIPNQQISIFINVFNSTHLIYNTTHNTVYSSSIQQMILPIQVQIFQSMDNITLEVIYSYYDFQTQQFKQTYKGYSNLTKFKKISKMNSQQYFASGQLGSSSNNQKGNYTLHIAQDFNIMILYSQMALSGKQAHLFNMINFTLTPFTFNGIQNQAKYYPRLDISQLHIPYKYYKPINGLLKQNNSTQNQIIQTQAYQQSSTNSQQLTHSSQQLGIKNHTIKIHIYPYDLMRYALFFQMFDPTARKQAQKMNPLMQYMMDQQAYDDMKQILFTNNLYIVALTIIMSVVKMILQVFALKNQFKIWNQIQKNKGLSLKILYTDLLFQIVFFLYLVDNQSNLMMTVPLGLNVLVVLWKIKKTIYIQTSNNFPFIQFKHYDWCKHHQQIDNQGVKYMYYGLGGLFIAYITYQMIISGSIATLFSYSGMLQKIVFFMGMAGFIRMTPQLYINYKLKSVDHLPWRTLIYRFIQTIIDDFYVFLVTTPLLHKIMVFRQDIIFLLYLYQRMIYKTDPNRIGTAGGMVLQKEQVEKATNALNMGKSQKNQ